MMYESHSEKDTRKIAEKFASDIRSGDVICIDGELGAGKTVFVSAFAKALGVTEYISSPTFTVVNEYSGKIPVFHFDVYRITDAEQMYDIGFDEYIFGNGVCIIEWSRNIEEILPRGRYEITIRRDYSKGDDYREIKIKKKA
ncbi:MAG: tRNA (adenosine(37)-N6)-threonylcarbamoyltransferase complex ATPase subunit type 1 TsaE [Oscillospiraceae bacterium]|nr:tRNA (adenosine(37)-N6)-threonylcarbamoyltransferase complex ATPase subunit type 1 TsaE [Oscillospiraceae bacterium]